MAKYKSLKGQSIQVLTADPPAPVEGQVWVVANPGTASVMKGYALRTVAEGTWASGGNLNTARRSLGGAGTQAAGLAFSGFSTTLIANTEAYNGSTWSEVNDVNTARQLFGSAGTVNTASLGFGGDTDPPNGTATVNTESWNGTSWTEVNNLNTARVALKGFGTSSLAIAAGGSPNSTLVENWNGTSWTEIAEINTGRQSIGAAGISNTAGIVFGGAGPEGEAETWNGTAWTEVGDLNTGRRSLSGSGDSSSALAMGGITTADQAVVESWNGSSWTEVADLATARGDSGSSHGAGNTTALFFGGDNPPIANTEEWTVPLGTVSFDID